jgi:hypothetical protein
MQRRGFSLLVGVAALAVTLASCTQSQTDKIRALTQAACGVLPSVASVGAVIATGQPMAGAAADKIASAICMAYASRVNKSMALVQPGCPEVGGVCVWAESVDLKKLKEFKG